MQTYFFISLLFLISLKEMVPQLYVIFYLIDIRFLLSFNRSAIITIIADCTEGTKPLSKATMNPASMSESATLTCLTLLQQMDPPQRVNTYPEVDYLDFIFDWN